MKNNKFTRWRFLDSQVESLLSNDTPYIDIARKIEKDNNLSFKYVPSVYPSENHLHDSLRKYVKFIHKHYIGEVKDPKKIEERKDNTYCFKTVPNYNSPILKKRVSTIKGEFKADHPHTGVHIILGCVHVPFHNKEIMNGLIQYMKDLGSELKGIHIIGDFLDMNTLSSHDVNKFTAVPGLTLNAEYYEGNLLLDEFDKYLSEDTIKTYIYGNHEDRYHRYMSNYENSKRPLMSPVEALRLEERGYNVMTRWAEDDFKLGNGMHLMHGTYCTDVASKQHMVKYYKTCVMAHTHRISSYVTSEMSGFNIGFLGDKSSPAFNYANKAMKIQWENGFGLVNIDKNGDYYFHQVICKNSKFFINNVQYPKL